jgi:hypothetical protein
MTEKESREAWVFYFFVESDSNEPVAYEVAEEFFDHILQSAEQRGLQVGGTFRAPTDEENNLDVLSHLK